MSSNISTNTETNIPRQSLRQDILKVGSIAIAYFLAHQIAFFFPDSEQVIMAVWPAAGIGLAALLLSPRYLWPAIIAALFVSGNTANLLAGRPFINSIGFMTANIIESIGSAWLITKWCGLQIRFTRINEIMVLIIAASIVNGFSATIGASTASLTHQAPFFNFWKTWWIADGLGILLVTPLIVVWSSYKVSFGKIRWNRIFEAGVFIAIWCSSTWLIFSTNELHYQINLQPYFIFALLAWVALKFDLRGVTIALIVFVCIAVTSTAALLGPLFWGGGTIPDRLLHIQLFIGLGAITGYLLAVTNTELKQSMLTSKERAKHYLTLFENASDGIMFLSPELDIVNVNESFAKMHGYTVDEMLRMNIQDLDTPESLRNAGDRGPRLLSGETLTFDVEHYHKKGHIIHLEVSASLVTIGNEKIIQTFHRNIDERKQAEEKLRENNSRLELAMNVANMAWWEMEIATGNVMFDNRKAEMLGYPPEKFKHYKDFMALVHPDDYEIAMNAMRGHFTGVNEKYEIEYRILTQSGDYKWFFDIGSITKKDANGKPLMIAGLVFNITERKKAEEKIREKDIQFRKLSANVSDLIFQFTRRPDGTYYVPIASEGIKNIFGCSPEDVLQDFAPIGRVIYPEDAERVIGDIEYSAKHLSLFTCEFRVQIPGKPIQWILSRSTPEKLADGSITWYGFNADITERKRSEELLAQEKERLSVTLRSIGDGVITTDVNGNIVMLNKAAEEMTGWKTDDAAGHPLPEVFVIINEQTREMCENPVEKVLSTGNIIELENHTCLISKDGRELIIADSGAPIRDKESQITGVVLVFRDMTEKQKLNDSMQRSQKLESVGILAGGIAHDFNNLLGGMFGYLEMAKDTVASNNPEKLLKYLDKATSVYDRATGLTKQLLTFSKGGTPIRKTIQITPLIQQSTNFALSGSNVSCKFTLAEDLWLCDCDENQIGQVIDNIVINAKQAMPIGGIIFVNADNVTDQIGHPGNFVRITIKDQGVGMPTEILSKIFDPFFSTKETGHGLGLATVFSIIKRHDGWVDVDSKPGKGSTFHLFLPAAQNSTSVVVGNKIVEHKGSGSILLMDDEDFMLEVVGKMLEDMGYEVVNVKNGTKALTFFTQAEKSGKPFVASILDLTIPGGMGGKETAAGIRKINPQSIIIASSGYSEDPVMSNPAEHEFNDKIIKPYRKKELSELMNKIMRNNKEGSQSRFS